MKPIGQGRLDVLKGAMGGEGDMPPMPDEGAPPDAGADIPGMIEALEMDALPGASPEQRGHIEKAIAELKMCVGGGEPEAPLEEPMPEPAGDLPA